MTRAASRKILFLDGRDAALDLERTFLARPEFRVIQAPPGPDPLETVRRERPDLLVLELHASGARALGVCRAVKADPLLKPTPVLLLGPPTRRREVREAGADAVVFTPLVQREFLAVVRRLIPLAARREPRCPVHLKVALSVGGEEVEASSADLSESGMSLYAIPSPSAGARVRLRFRLPGDDREIACGAVVRGSRGAAGTSGGFGVEFEGPSSADRERISGFVRGRLSTPVELP